MDIKSHQSSPPFYPTEALVNGNAKVDQWCETARLLSKPDDVKIPSSRSIAFLCYKGRMITASPAAATRRILRDQATAQLRLLTVQGGIPSLGTTFFHRSLEFDLFTNVSIPPRWDYLRLPSDPRSHLDLSPAAHRIFRSIGGSWTELQHSDSDILLKATAWSTACGINVRTCPLCHRGTGDTRHVIFACPYTANWANSLRDDMESLLASLAPPATLLALAQEWRQLASHEIPTFATNSAEATN